VLIEEHKMNAVCASPLLPTGATRDGEWDRDVFLEKHASVIARRATKDCFNLCTSHSTLHSLAGLLIDRKQGPMTHVNDKQSQGAYRAYAEQPP
jgi:hypothetical protein